LYLENQRIHPNKTYFDEILDKINLLRKKLLVKLWKIRRFWKSWFLTGSSFSLALPSLGLIRERMNFVSQLVSVILRRGPYIFVL